MIPWFQYVTLYIGPVPIRVWGFFVALGVGTSLYILYRRSKKMNLPAQALVDHAFFVVLIGLLGARIFHIVFYEPAFYFSNPLEMLKIWHGGLSSYGGFAGAVVGFLWYAKRKKIPASYWLAYADVFAYASVIGWMIARVGCFMIHDHLGAPCNSFLAIQTPDGPRLEMALLEILALLPLALYLYFGRNKKRPQGWYLAIVCMYYGTVRFILDFWRATDIVGADVRYFGLTPAQYFSIVMAGCGLYLLRKISSHRGKRA